jgi:hypothetical protein
MELKGETAKDKEKGHFRVIANCAEGFWNIALQVERKFTDTQTIHKLYTYAVVHFECHAHRLSFCTVNVAQLNLYLKGHSWAASP